VERNLEITPRIENSREKQEIPSLHIQPLQEILERFNDNITCIKNRFSVIDCLPGDEDQKTQMCEDVYRSQIVFVESALDYYMHELSIYAMIQMYNSTWKKTGAYENLKIPISTVAEAIKNPENSSWVEEHIIGHHSIKTYMAAQLIKGNLSLLDKGLFDEVAKKLYVSESKPSEKLSNVLDSYFQRRNYIAHQSDRDLATIDRHSINHEYVEKTIDEISNFINTLHQCIEAKLDNFTV
jgi:hypothetical protein